MSGIATERDALVMRLEDELARLRRELADKDDAVTRERLDFHDGVKNLRRVLTPLYVGLQQVFGELDAVKGEITDDTPRRSGGADVDDRIRRVWDDWKTKLPSTCGRVIDALLVHGGLTQQQIAVAAQISVNTLKGGNGVIAKLNRAGLLHKNGNRYALKTL